MPNSSEHFIIPGKPVTSNHAYKIVTRRRKGGAGTYSSLALTDEANAWKELVMLCVKAQRVQPHQDWTGKSIGFRMVIHMKNPLLIDGDGGRKLTQDAVADALGFNDKYVYAGCEVKEAWIDPTEDEDSTHVIVYDMETECGVYLPATPPDLPASAPIEFAAARLLQPPPEGYDLAINEDAESLATLTDDVGARLLYWTSAHHKKRVVFEMLSDRGVRYDKVDAEYPDYRWVETRIRVTEAE